MTGIGTARFDDLVAGVAWKFERPTRAVSARSVAGVRDVLRAVDDATRKGCWAYGYVAAEAAAAFDTAFPARHAGAEGDELPLAWFAFCDPPSLVEPVDAPSASADSQPQWLPDWTAEQHGDRVRQVRAAIAAGAVYQCNLTTRLRAAAPADPMRHYAQLAHAQRGAYNSYLDIGSHVVVSASPELFFKWDDDRLLCRPMKGTAPRGDTLEEDEQRRAALVTSGKERAENVMIVDLMRNDLSRIAVPGTVRVSKLFRAERYETVWQLTSDVTAIPKPDATLDAIFGALFPPGSVTGAPKAAALSLIDRLEDAPRGVYCGAIGMVAPPGEAFRARFAVGIRTTLVDRRASTACYGIGSGITWGSDAAAEYHETVLKSAILTASGRPFHLLETMRFVPYEGVRNLDGHLARLADSARYFGIHFDADAARAELVAVASAQVLRVRLLLDRNGARTLDCQPLDPPARRPVRLAIDEPGPPVDRWCRHKTTHRERYEAAAARHPEADDVILTDARGRIIETTIANLAVRLASRWYTPDDAFGCLPGVERARLLAAGELTARTLTVADLEAAEQLAVVSSLRGWRPAELDPSL